MRLSKNLASSAAIVVAVVAVSAAAIALSLSQKGAIPSGTELPPTVVLAAGPYLYRPAGEFRVGTRIVDAPRLERLAARDVRIMKYPVTQSAYAKCVADGACDLTTTSAVTNAPQVDVSYNDAVTYAQWLSDTTGTRWRLPTDEEWVRAAGSRFVDDAVATASDDPSDRWLARYRKEVRDRGEADPVLHPIGSFGENDLGVADINGNVWEWTEGCFLNGTVSEDGTTIVSSAGYCGVRSVQGRHRAFVIDFVRDAKVGGCAVGVPPDYLGFRLVRDAG